MTTQVCFVPQGYGLDDVSLQKGRKEKSRSMPGKGEDAEMPTIDRKEGMF